MPALAANTTSMQSADLRVATYLVGCLGALLSMTGLGALHFQSEEGTTLYSAFLDRQRAVELRARSLKIVFLDIQYENDRPEPALVSSGYCEHVSDYEKWVRWTAPWSTLESRGLSSTDSDSVHGALRSFSPIIECSDGSRALSLQPYRGYSLLWYGLLQGEVDRRIRRGALNCGLMFGERWLSEHLQSFTLVTAERTDNGQIRFELKHIKSPDDTVTLLTDDDYLLHAIEWRKREAPVASATIAAHTAVDSIQLISEATIVYEYSTRTVNTISLSYEPSLLQRAPPLLEIPLEISSAGGAMLVSDKLTGAQYPLGNPAILGQLQAGENDPSSEPSPLPGYHPSTAILALIAVALLAIAVLLKRYRMKSQSNLRGLILLASCLLPLGCSDSTLTAEGKHHTASVSDFFLVLPSAHQAIRSADRGETVTIQYDIHNVSDIDYEVAVEGKSCDCIGVSFSTSRLPGGDSTQIALVSTIPQAGQTSGSTSIQFTPTTPSDQPSEIPSILLSYEIHAILGPGLHVAPASLRVGADSPQATRTLTLICNVESKPTDTVARWLDRTLEIHLLSPWQLSTGWSALCELSLPSGAECLEYDAPVELLVTTADAGTHTASIQVQAE